MSTMAEAAATMAKTGVPVWVSLCGQLAPISSIVVFLAPIPTLRQVSIDKSVGSLPLLPYSSMLSSAFLWVVYGILKQESKIWSANGVGLVLGIYYFLEFVRYSPKRAPTLPGSVAQHLQGCCAIIGTTALVATLLPTSQATTLLGNSAVVFCVCMFASPLAALKVVLQTRSAKSIPLPFTVASVVNCFLWSVLGLFDMHDFNVYAPNLLGLGFGLIQAALRILFGDGAESTLPRSYSNVELPA